MEHQQEYATLAHASYKDVDAARQMAKSYEWEVADSDTDASSNRHHTLFKRGDETVLAFRGTDVKRSRARDLLTDAQLALGITPRELKQASRIAAQMKEKHGDKLTIVGHSLGGAKALHASKKLAVKSVTFNPYIGPGMGRGLHGHMRETGSEAHIHVDDPIGSSAAQRLPKDAVVAYTHSNRNTHAIKHFQATEGVRLSDKKKRSTVAKRIATLAGVGAAVGGAIGAVGAGAAAAASSKRRQK